MGHTHFAQSYLYSGKSTSFIETKDFIVAKENKYIVNVGSVGQPRDGDSRACFCFFDSDQMVIEICRVKYDIDLVQRKIFEAGLPTSLAERLVLGQ